jgi:hypothetical protein
VIWRHRTRTSISSSALTTGGGLAVVGDADRYLYIHDAATGKILYQTRLPSAPKGFPMTYAVRGKQYLAIPVGEAGQYGDDQGVPRRVDIRDLLPGSAPRQLAGSTSMASLIPEKRVEAAAATSVNAIFVFALPETARGPSR